MIELKVDVIIDSTVTDSWPKNMPAVCRLVYLQSSVKLCSNSQTNSPNNILALCFIGRSTYLKVGGTLIISEFVFNYIWVQHIFPIFASVYLHCIVIVSTKHTLISLLFEG